jgi:hypothetical protein
MVQYVIDFLKLLFPHKDNWSAIEIIGVLALLIGLSAISYIVFKN